NDLISKYNEELKKYEEKTKIINDLIQEILNLFWSNISMSDLLNKEREKIYLNLNIEKLLKISNKNSQHILNDLLTKMKELQSNSNKKQFTNDIHQYLNTKINHELTLNQYQIRLPIKLKL
ncbi:unnamed protein product, partial [Didymodactylos carnosus]